MKLFFMVGLAVLAVVSLVELPYPWDLEAMGACILGFAGIAWRREVEIDAEMHAKYDPLRGTRNEENEEL